MSTSEPTPPNYFVVFLRHGESVGNAEDRFQGQYDSPLSDKGKTQARALAERWQAEEMTFDQCISSPLLRARQTAEIVTGVLKIPLEFDPLWMEINNGLLAGLNDEEAARVAPRPQFMTPYDHYGQTGESGWEMFLRAGRGIQNLLDRPPGRFLVVAHGGILNMTMYTVLSIMPQADFQGPRFLFHNTGFATFNYEPERHNWRMLGFDSQLHWKNE